MSIRITNKNTGRTYIIKNQDDIDHLKTGVSSFDDSDDDFKMFDDEPFAGTPDENSSLQNRRAYKTGDTAFDLDSIDDEAEDHYINASRYPLEDEEASWSDPTTVDAPVNRLITPDIPDDQTTEFDLDDDGFAAEDDMGFGDEGQDDEFSFGDDDGFGTSEEGDPDFQGTIRTVRGACLVYKRKTENGTYEELWVFNVGDNIKQETSVRKAILAGTDIDPNTHMSDDGEQKAKTITIGNVQYLNITGMVQ